jgi:hypothetical protein
MWLRGMQVNRMGRLRKGLFTNAIRVLRGAGDRIRPLFRRPVSLDSILPLRQRRRNHLTEIRRLDVASNMVKSSAPTKGEWLKPAVVRLPSAEAAFGGVGAVDAPSTSNFS